MDGTGDLFAPFLSELGNKTRTIVVRYPTRDFLDYPQLIALVNAQLPNHEPYILLAESFSGPVAISVAATQPTNLAGLILCASFARNPRLGLGSFLRSVAGVSLRAPTWMMASLLLDGFRSDDSTRRLALAVAQVDPNVMNARFQAILKVDVTQQLERIQVPSLYLRGTKDFLVPKQTAQLIVATRNNWRLIELVSPHLILQAIPRLAADIVDRFVAELRSKLA